MSDRPDQLGGRTVKVRFNDGRKLYATINRHDGAAYEVFLRSDAPDMHEWLAITSVLVSWLLQGRQVDINDIAAEMQGVHSMGANTGFLPGGGEYISMVDMIGRALHDNAI